MLIEQEPHVARRHWGKWLWVLGAFLILLLVGVVLLMTNWPLSRKAITDALQEASGHPVLIGNFSTSYIPPGCTATDVRILQGQGPGAEPLITVKQLVLRANLFGLLQSPHRLSTVLVQGMHMTVPQADGKGNGKVLLNSGPGGKGIAISEIIADGAILSFLREDPRKKPYVLKVERLALTNVGSGNPMYYRATLQNTEPPGVIRSEGKFGPWNPTDMGATPLSGTYTYDKIDLGVFEGIAGMARGTGRFSGPLSRIRTQGKVDVDGFRVQGSDHKVQIATTFDAQVNGTNGDVLLNPAKAHYRRTEVDVRGWIAQKGKQSGKTAAFDISVPRGRVDDLLYLFTKGQPGMSGDVSLSGQFLWPPGPRDFLQKIEMSLTFGLKSSHFSNENTQNTIDRLSKSAEGEGKKQSEEDQRTMLANVRGGVQVRNGQAVISNGKFEVPGAVATVAGTYNLVNEKVNLHGTLDTRGTLSSASTGFKALVLKAATPLFRKKHSVRIVPFQITGAYGTTNVSIDWKKDLKGSD
jgi:hypothetical protein